jgi:hypothetical protein
MDKMDADIDRLLRAAAAAQAGTDPIEAPFGFDTRVVARWRSERSVNGRGLRAFTRLFQSVAVSAALVTIFASAGAYWQLSENDELSEPMANAYAIADGVIEAGTSP